MERNAGNILAVSIIVIFLVLGLIRLYPYENHLDNVLRYGDDWHSYAEHGLDIAQNGILLPMVEGPYRGPGGFLYNYFIALCFFLFGENIIPIYIIQHLMMGLSVAVMYWTFRDKLKSSTGIMFLGTLSLFTFLDVYKYYAVRLLSENLAFLLVPVFFFCFIRGFEKDNIRLQLASAILMGVLVLVRTNMVICVLALLFVVIQYYLKRGKKGIVHLAMFISITSLIASLLGVRNYLVCGKWYFLPVHMGLSGFMRLYHPIPESVNLSNIDNNIIRVYFAYLRQEPLLFFSYYVKKILFCFGFTSTLVPIYRWRPHWMLMWLGYFMYLFLGIKDRRRFEMWEIAVHLYIISYYVPLIAVVNIHNYGFRMLIPAVNFVLLFSFLAWDRLLGRRLEEGSPYEH